MAKPFRLCFVFLTAALLAPSLSAQMRGGGGFGGGSLGGSSLGGGTPSGGSMRGTPMTQPPAPHPALGGQPLFDNSLGNNARPGPSSNGCMPGPAGPAADPATMGKKAEGKELKAAVKKVNSLHWNNSLADARAEALATGKPVLWLQALGDIDGFA